MHKASHNPQIRSRDNDCNRKLAPLARQVFHLLAALVVLVPMAVWAAGRSPGQQTQPDAFQLGLDALKDGHLDQALEELTKAEGEHTDDARIRNFRGIVLARLGRNTEAASEYRDAIRLDPGMGSAYRNLGFLLWTEHDLANAQTQLQQSLKLAPDDSFAHYYLGRVLLDEKKYMEAFGELESSRVSWPEDASLYIQATNGYLALGRMAEANQSLTHLNGMRLTHTEVVGVASLLISANRSPEAIRLLESLDQQTKNAPWLRFDLALAHLLAGDYQQCVDALQAYLQSRNAENGAPSDAPVYSLIGIAQAHLHQGDNSVESFRRATKLDPGEEEFWLNLTRELMDMGQFPDAIASAQTGLATNVKSYALRLRLGAAYLASSRYPEAEGVFRELIAAGDPLPTSYVGLAQVLLRTDRPQDAVTELTQAQAKLGSGFLISYFLGLAFDRAGQRAQAAAAFSEAVRLNPSNSEAHLALGRALMAQGQMDQAIAEFDKSLRINPQSVQAERLLAQTRVRAGKQASPSAEATTQATPATQPDFLGDFVVPQWQVPQEDAASPSTATR